MIERGTFKRVYIVSSHDRGENDERRATCDSERDCNWTGDR